MATQEVPFACTEGHPYDDRNVYIDRRGNPRCRECAREKRKAADR